MAAIGIGNLFPMHYVMSDADFVGFAAYNYYTEAKSQRDASMLEEKKRLARNQQLMDAYGDKDSLNDVQHALDTYKVQ